MVESYLNKITGFAILLNFITAASGFIDNSHSYCPLFPTLFVCREKRGKELTNS